jgi:hypothetical protein
MCARVTDAPGRGGDRVVLRLLAGKRLERDGDAGHAGGARADTHTGSFPIGTLHFPPISAID